MINCSALKISFYFSADFPFFSFRVHSLYIICGLEICVYERTELIMMCCVPSCVLLHELLWHLMMLSRQQELSSDLHFPLPTTTTTTLKKVLKTLLLERKMLFTLSKFLNYSFWNQPLAWIPESRGRTKTLWRVSVDYQLMDHCAPLTLVVRETMWWTRLLSYFMQFLQLPGRGRGSTEVIEAAYCCWLK